MSNKPRYILVVLLALMVAWTLICASVHDTLPVSFELRRLSLPVVTFVLLSFMLTWHKDKMFAICLAVFGLSAFIESILGALQMVGAVPSRHPGFNVTGNFVNPGPYGGYLSLAALTAFAFLLKYRPRGWKRVAAVVVGAASFLMMVFSRSRSAWLAFAVVGAVLVFSESRIFARLKHKGLIVAAAVVVIATAGFGAYKLKPDSARGRFHIWQMDCLVIADNPLMGTGPGLEMGAFGDVQADFYASHPHSHDKMNMASIAEYPFNEFLGAGMSCGIPGLVLAIAVYVLMLVIHIRRRSMLLWPLAALGLFAMFSYPLSQTATTLVFVLCLADAAAGESLSRKGAIVWGTAAVLALLIVAPSLSAYAKVKSDKIRYRRLLKAKEFTSMMYPDYYDTQRYSAQFLYYYALSEYSSGNVDHAVELLHEAAPLDSEPFIHTLLGECMLAQGRYDEALQSFLRAYYVSPTRVLPLLKIMGLYKSAGRKDLVREVRDYALSLPVKRTQTKTIELRKSIRNYEY